MSDRTRAFLKPEFRDGERPSGGDFADLIDSVVNKVDDGVQFDTDGNMKLTRGVQLGDSNGVVAGGLRFNSNQLQLFTGGGWVNVSGGGGGGGAFAAPPTGPATAVAHNGNVGIGNFPAAPTYRLEVPLGGNTGTGEQVRFGNVVCANGIGITLGAAVFSHRNHATPTDYALRQEANGAVQLNAASGQAVTVSQGGGVRLGVSVAGRVIVGNDNDLPGSSGEALQVSGTVFKTSPGSIWAGSDARIKEDVRDLELGLPELCRVRPVRFRYNGRAGTTAGEAGVGVLGQEIEAIVPETIKRVSVPSEPGLDDMRIFDPSALTFILINAVKELATRVEQLEQALAATAGMSGAVPAIK